MGKRKRENPAESNSNKRMGENRSVRWAETPEVREYEMFNSELFYRIILTSAFDKIANNTQPVVDWPTLKNALEQSFRNYRSLKMLEDYKSALVYAVRKFYNICARLSGDASLQLTLGGVALNYANLPQLNLIFHQMTGILNSMIAEIQRRKEQAAARAGLPNARNYTQLRW